MKKCIC